VLIENAANGPAVTQRLKANVPGVVEINPEGGILAPAALGAQNPCPRFTPGSVVTQPPDPSAWSSFLAFANIVICSMNGSVHAAFRSTYQSPACHSGAAANIRATLRHRRSLPAW